MDEVDALFDDAFVQKVVRSALELPAPAPVPVKSLTKKADLTLKQGQGGDKSVKRHAELGAVVDVIKIAPRREGKKRSKRRLDPA